MKNIQALKAALVLTVLTFCLSTSFAAQNPPGQNWFTRVLPLPVTITNTASSNIVNVLPIDIRGANWVAVQSSISGTASSTANFIIRFQGSQDGIKYTPLFSVTNVLAGATTVNSWVWVNATNFYGVRYINPTSCTNEAAASVGITNISATLGYWY